LRARRGRIEASWLAPVHDAAERGAGAARSLARAVGVRRHRAVALDGVDPAPPLGSAMNRTLFAFFALVASLAACASPAAAGDRYALIVTGASGGDAYAEKYTTWRTAMTAILREKFHYPPDRVVVLAETEGEGVQKSTRENVQRALGD